MRPRTAAVCLASAALLCGLVAGPAGAFEAQVRTTRVTGTPIAWYERGRGEPLLMLTGTGSTMAEWDPALLRRLASRRRLILLDYPGVGLSGPWRGSDFDSLADSVGRLLGAIGVPRADVLGWSMGGFVAQRLALRHPRRVTGLVLAGTNPGGPPAVLGTPAAQRVDSEPHPGRGAILRLLYPPGRRAEGRRFLGRLARASRTGEIPDDFHVAVATTRAQVAAEGHWLHSGRNYRQLARLRVPTLAAAGDRDPVTPAANMRRIAARIPGARLRVLHGAHAFLFQGRIAFARAVTRVLGP